MLITRILPLLLLGMFMTGCGNREKAETTDSSARVLDEHEFRQRLDQVNPGLRDPAAVIRAYQDIGSHFPGGSGEFVRP